VVTPSPTSVAQRISEPVRWGGDLFFADFERELAVGDVEGDGVAFVDGGDGAAELKASGSDVAGHEAAGGAGEAAVGERATVSESSGCL
jgi:hypothetical protein